jgi:hypothetical protein
VIKLKKIPHSVVERLGWYVYAYVDSTDRRIHYIGKGCGQRALAHLMRLDHHRVEIIAHCLRDEDEAYAIERAVIDVLELTKLVNKVRGKGARYFGRELLEDLIYRYAARRIDIDESSVLIRVNRLYRPGMSADELYEITRGVWKIGPRRDKCQYAFAVYRGVVREIYEIEKPWLPAGKTKYEFRRSTKEWTGRWEFLGRVADAPIRRRYLGGSVKHLLPDGAQNPIRYVP